MGTAERRERERQRRKNEIIDAAERVFFSKGLEQTTMEEVAHEAELSKGTLYLYFKSKEELYLAINERGLILLQDIFREAVSREQSGLGQIQAIGRSYFEFARQHSDYFNAMLYYEARQFDSSDVASCARACEKAAASTLKMVAETIRTGVKDGSIRAEMDPFKTAVVLWGQSSGVVQVHAIKGRQLQDTHSLNPDDIIQVSLEMMLRSLQKEKKKQ